MANGEWKSKVGVVRPFYSLFAIGYFPAPANAIPHVPRGYTLP
jgi:hypothetical protein